MRVSLLAAGLVMVLLVSVCAMGADWPQFLGPNRNAISPEKGINKDWGTRPPKMLWKVPMGDGGFAGPSVADGKVFIIDHKGADDIVRAININTGENVWTFTYADTAENNYGFSQSTPAVDGDKVYTLSRRGWLHCLTVKDGKKVWARNIITDFKGRLPAWQMAMSPAVDGDRLIVVPGGPDAAVAVLNKKTGETIWTGGGSDMPGYATPFVATIDGKKVYVVFTGAHLMGVDPENGKVLWQFEWRTPNDVNAATPIVSGDTIFITSNYNRGCALVKIAGGKAEKAWENKAIHSHFSTGILVGGCLYSTSDNNRMVCLDLKTGEVKWEQKNGFEKGGIVGVDGVIIALNGAGGDAAMIEITPAEYKELGRFKPLGGQSWTAPIVADGKLIVRNTKELACFDLK